MNYGLYYYRKKQLAQHLGHLTCLAEATSTFQKAQEMVQNLADDHMLEMSAIRSLPSHTLPLCQHRLNKAQV